MKKIIIGGIFLVTLSIFYHTKTGFFDSIGHFFTHTVGDSFRSAFQPQAFKGSFDAFGRIIYKQALQPAGNFFTETVWEKGLKEGLYEKGLRDTIYEKGLKEAVYEKGLKEMIYEEGFKEGLYDIALKKWAYKVGLNWVGEKILVPTLTKFIVPALKLTLEATSKIEDAVMVVYDKALAPWVGPIWEKALMPVLDPIWQKAIDPTLKWTDEKILHPVEEVAAKALSPAIDQLLYPIRKFEAVLDDAANNLAATKTTITGDFIYQTNAQGQFITDADGEKIPKVDKDGAPIQDPNKPALPDLIISAITPVFGLIEQFSNSEAGGTSFIDVVSNIVVNIYELRKQIRVLQQTLTQNIMNLKPEEKKTLQDALTAIDADLKGLADAVTLPVDQLKGYQLVRAADPAKKIESIFCPAQGGSVCKIVYASIASKITYDVNLTKINKLMEKLGDDINKGSSTCSICQIANISDADCTFPMRLQLGASLLKQLVNGVIEAFLQKIAGLDVTAVIEALGKDAIAAVLPGGVAQAMRNMAHGLGH